MPWPKTGANHCYAQLGVPDKGCAIKELIVCCVLPNLTPLMFGQKRRDTIPLSYPWLLNLMLGCHGHQPQSFEVINEITNSKIY